MPRSQKKNAPVNNAKKNQHFFLHAEKGKITKVFIKMWPSCFRNISRLYERFCLHERGLGKIQFQKK